MTVTQPKTITKRQAKRQIGYFGRSLIIYIVLFTVLTYGTELIHTYFPQVFQGYNHHMMMLGISIVVMIFLTAIPFRITNKKLSLNIP